MTYERIDNSKKFDGKTRDSHEIRYRIARQFVGLNDVVIDACCGIGYGKEILEDGRFGVWWKGLDKEQGLSGVQKVDFEDKDFIRKYEFETLVYDVFVGLEAIEHLNDVGVNNFVELAKEAQKYIVVSTPIIKNSNPFHKQQFNFNEIMHLFEEKGVWELYSYFEQDFRYGIFVFKRV